MRRKFFEDMLTGLKRNMLGAFKALLLVSYFFIPPTLFLVFTKKFLPDWINVPGFYLMLVLEGMLLRFVLHYKDATQYAKKKGVSLKVAWKATKYGKYGDNEPNSKQS